MKLAFCLFKFFPYGGLQRDFLRMAKACQQKGHSIHVFTQRWEGERPDGFVIHLVKSKGWSNHRRAFHFSQAVQKEFAKNHYDAVIGFNRMPGLDFYFCADICFARNALEKHASWFKFTSRYKNYIRLERAVFSPDAKTKIFYITDNEKNDYQKFYNTPTERFYFLPPGMQKNNFINDSRKKIREDFQVKTDEKLLLMVGSDFARKGVERSILALAALPQHIQNKCKLFIIGRGKANSYLKLADQYGIKERVCFLGTRDDVRNCMSAADLLLHPAYFETAGMVIIEALIMGLPILVTENCGYAQHVVDANAGLIIPNPFDQKQMNDLLLKIIQELTICSWRENALSYAAKTDLYSMTDKVVQLIENSQRN